jgi:hypothetical protein
VLRNIAGHHGQDSFLVRQDLPLPLLDPYLILKDHIQSCLICLAALEQLAWHTL